MLRLSKLTDYATVVMTRLAQAPADLHSAQSLADRTLVEVPTVSKVLKKLARAGLVESQRGAQGGYRLARPAAEITVAEIIAALEGPLGMTECSIHEGLCSQEPVCSVRRNWRKISRAIVAALDEVTLADMAEPLDESVPVRVRMPSDRARARSSTE